jgi:hypothetical protein
MSIIDNVRGIIESQLDQRLAEMKPIAEQGEPLEKRLKEDGYGRKGLIFDPFTDVGYSGGVYKPRGAGSGFISNLILKLISRRDPIVSTILHTRATQAASFCRLPSNRFDTGIEVRPRDGVADGSQEEIKEIEEFLLNTGELQNRSKEDMMTLDQAAYALVFDMLTYGHCAIEKVHDMEGKLYAFLPLPAETIYYANKKLMDKNTIQNTIDSYKEAYQKMNGVELGQDFESPEHDYTWLQVINGKVVEGFTASELVFAKFVLQTDIDLNGYAIGPLERAISMITSHLQIENHQKMFFTHGIASKGLLVIQGDVTPNQMRTLQAQWTQQTTGPQTAWRTPVLGGIKSAQWIPLTATNRDMEYAAYQDHVIRTMHSCFAIDPEETGFGYLSKGVEQRSLSESSNEWKITASRDRGLRPLLNRIEQIINEDILPAWNQDYADRYQICFVGLDAETRSEEIQRLQNEVQLHTTLDEARKQADLGPMEVGGGLILNGLLLQTLQANMYKGEFMEKFLKVKGAASRPDLQYVPDQFWFQQQQMQMQMLQQQAQAEAAMQKEPPEKPKKRPEDPAAAREMDRNDQHEEAVDQHHEQQAQAQAQAIAVDRFIDANPELFKSFQENLSKAEAQKEANAEHVERLRDGLVADFERGANFLMKEIMEALKEDVGERPDDKEGK